MVRRWTLDEATAALPEVRAIVGRVRELVETARKAEGEPFTVTLYTWVAAGDVTVYRGGRT